MTTIAYRDGVMAGDGRCTSQSNIVLTERFRKVWKLHNGVLIGACGFSSSVNPYIAWLKNPVGERPSLGDKDSNTAMIVVRPNGKIEDHDWIGIDQMDAPFFAIGSGRYAAFAAMHMGADATKAVQIAAKLDPFTGGRIRTVRLA